MFRKKIKEKENQEDVESNNRFIAKYEKPKILFIDLPGGSFGKARSKGHTHFS